MWRGWEFSKATYLSMTTAGVWDAIAGKDGGARFFLRYQRVVEKRRNHVLEQGVEKGMELHRMDSRSRRVRERGRERERETDRGRQWGESEKAGRPQRYGQCQATSCAWLETCYTPDGTRYSDTMGNLGFILANSGNWQQHSHAVRFQPPGQVS